MKQRLIILILLSCFNLQSQISVSIEEVGALPESVANNAVCEGFIDDVPYVFSFGGIDSTKIYSGIHLKSFRYNIETGVSERIADLPDNMGKIAAGASRIGNIIYIIGGYHVFSNGSEVSSSKVHRYDIVNNEFLSDGASIPVAIDDHVQVILNDSLIYVVTGWSNFANVSAVQIYNPALDEWSMGTSTPGSSSYRSFGASGAIVDHTIYYYGGATSTSGFGPQTGLRKGVINPNNPLEIEWSISVPDPSLSGYRMACTQIDDTIFWVGGSANTYNYNGIAYDGSGGVPTTDRVLYKNSTETEFSEIILNEIPMDLRGIANVSGQKKYVAGGMIDDQMVTNKIYELTFSGVSSSEDIKNDQGQIKISPNPFNDRIHILSDGVKSVEIYNILGRLVQVEHSEATISEINVSELSSGTYFVVLTQDGVDEVKRMIK